MTVGLLGLDALISSCLDFLMDCRSDQNNDKTLGKSDRMLQLLRSSTLHCQIVTV